LLRTARARLCSLRSGAAPCLARGRSPAQSQQCTAYIRQLLAELPLRPRRRSSTAERWLLRQDGCELLARRAPFTIVTNPRFVRDLQSFPSSWIGLQTNSSAHHACTRPLIISSTGQCEPLLMSFRLLGHLRLADSDLPGRSAIATSGLRATVRSFDTRCSSRGRLPTDPS